MQRTFEAVSPAREPDAAPSTTVTPGKVPLTHRVQRFARGTEQVPAWTDHPG
jgi:hypothetical protein